MDRGKLFFTIGLPRSGKSSYCDGWVAGTDHATIENGGVLRPRVIVCGDDFRKALHGHSYLPEAEGAVFAMMDVATRALLSRGFDVLIDETCTTEATLCRYLRIDLDASPIWMETSAEECKRRAVASGKPFLLGPIQRMAYQLDISARTGRKSTAASPTTARCG